MIAAIDVQYKNNRAAAGLVVFRNWLDGTPTEKHIQHVNEFARYEPGRFYKRELPVILETLKLTSAPIDTIVVDGYADLAQGRPGLGRYLFNELNEKVRVIGVAKSQFADDGFARQILRGKSTRPLYVTAAGMGVDDAAKAILSMHGPNRNPTLLKLVDSIARGHIAI